MSFKVFRVPAAAAGVVLIFFTPCVQAQIAPSTDDLWDVSNGTQVTGNSAVHAGFSINDMFGAQQSTTEARTTIFTDAHQAGYVHWVEWETPTANTVTAMVLSAAHDGPPYNANQRGFSRFTLYAKNPDTNQFDLVLVQYDTENPYENSTQPPNGVANFNQTGNEIRLCVNFPPVTASEFRAEFVQFGDNVAAARGPRITELDGYTVSPCALLIANAGLNDAWFNLATAGQGVFVNVFPVIGYIFIAIFTYDTERPPQNVQAILGEPGHRWVTAFGPYDGNFAVLDAELTSGGVFDSAQPAVQQEANYGTITLNFVDCNTLILTYDFPGLGISGQMQLTRLAPDNVALCEELADGGAFGQGG